MSDELNANSMENMTYGVQTPQDIMEDPEYGTPQSDDNEVPEPTQSNEQPDPQADFDEATSENLRRDVDASKQTLDDELNKLEDSDLGDDEKRGRKKELHKQHIHSQAEKLTGDKNPTLAKLNVEIQKHNLSFLHEAAQHKGDVGEIQKNLAEQYSNAVNEAIVEGKSPEEIEEMLVQLTGGRYEKGSMDNLDAFLESGDFQAFFEDNVDVSDMAEALLEVEELQELKDELDKATEGEEVPGETVEQREERAEGLRSRINEFFRSGRSSKANKKVSDYGEKIPMEDLLDLVFLAQIKSGHYRSYSEDLGWGAEPKDKDKEREMLQNLTAVTTDKTKFEGFLKVVLHKPDDANVYQEKSLVDMDSFFENLKKKDPGHDYLLEGKQLFVMAFQKILNKSVPVEKIHFSHNVNEFIMVALKKYCAEPEEETAETPEPQPTATPDTK